MRVDVMASAYASQLKSQALDELLEICERNVVDIPAKQFSEELPPIHGGKVAPP